MSTEIGLHCSLKDLVRGSAGEVVGIYLDHDLVQVLDGLLHLLCAFFLIQSIDWDSIDLLSRTS